MHIHKWATKTTTTTHKWPFTIWFIYVVHNITFSLFYFVSISLMSILHVAQRKARKEKHTFTNIYFRFYIFLWFFDLFLLYSSFWINLCLLIRKIIMKKEASVNSTTAQEHNKTHYVRWKLRDFYYWEKNFCIIVYIPYTTSISIYLYYYYYY